MFFNRAWVPYDERLPWFAEADLGVSAHEDSLEARLAFRTRLLDHIAAGTPLVVTQGDVLAELVEARGMGRTRRRRATSTAGPPPSPSLLDDERAYAAARTGGRAAAQAELSWSRVGAAARRADRARRVVAAAAVGAAGCVLSARPRRWRARRVERRGLRATLAAAARAVSSSRRR